MQLLSMFRCKYASKAEIKSRKMYNFCETVLVLENHEEGCRMRNMRDIEILTNASFSAIINPENLMSVDHRMTLISSKISTSESQ